MEQLEIIVAKLREATNSVSSDLGITSQDVGPVELVDLIDGSGGLVFEQYASPSVEQYIVPLIATIDNAMAFARGTPLNPLLTDRSRSAVADLVGSYRRNSTEEAPIAFTETRTTYQPGGMEHPKTVIDSYFNLLPVGTTPTDDAPVKESASVLQKEAEEHLPRPGEWVLTFTGTLRQLNGIDTKIWVTTSRGVASAKVSRSVFQTADVDAARWHTVTAVCLSESPEVKGIREFLHVAPAENGSPEYVATPMNEAAKGITRTLDRIDDFSALRPGWNSHGGRPISGAARRAARGFLLLASSTLRNVGLTLNEPFASPLPNGHVQLEWEQGNKYLELEFADDGSLGFLRMHEDASAEGPATTDTALDMVTWFHKGTRR